MIVDILLRAMAITAYKTQEVCTFQLTYNLPICQREFGPATEYTRLLVSPPGHLKAELSGSLHLNADLILARGILYPRERKRPAAIDSPTPW